MFSTWSNFHFFSVQSSDYNIILYDLFQLVISNYIKMVIYIFYFNAKK